MLILMKMVKIPFLFVVVKRRVAGCRGGCCGNVSGMLVDGRGGCLVYQ